MKQKFLAVPILGLFTFIFSAELALAGSATVSWNANTESDLAGYKIYYGTSPRAGTDPKTCGMCGYSNVTSLIAKPTTSYTFNNLTNGQTYYFSVTAIDASNNESPFSSPEAHKTISTSGLKSDLGGGPGGTPDGHVNSVDFGILMSYWGATNKPPADLGGGPGGTQDGYVNSVDFGIMMSEWTG